MSDWISVKDELPPCYGRVLCWNTNSGLVEICALRGWDVRTDFPWGPDMDTPLGRTAFEITHWMPLPGAPEVSDA